MEGGSALSPSSWEKRRAWARQSRCWRTTVVEEEAAAAMQDLPELQPPHLDDVFLEGSPSSKIETWLQECGSSVEAPPEELGLPGPFGCGSAGTSFEDDLTLGAEALLLPGSDRTTGRALRDRPLHLGHSMASSAFSSLTAKTSSSISEVLEWRQADAEQLLCELGFVGSEPGAVGRIPPRFFAAPSRARGIDFQLFLKAQVRRMEMEDPCLMLASRFQQVQALAATADAFFCLYSYVSRTPLQRFSPSRPPWACPDLPDIRVSPAQPCALSPVDRLKKVVSTMCLYTAPLKGSPRTPPVPPSQPSAMGRVVQEVLERARGGRFRFEPDEALQGLGREGGDTGMGCHWWGDKGDPPEAGWGLCPHHGDGDVPVCSGGEGELSPRLELGGTWGCPERSCGCGWGDGDTPTGGVQGDRDAPCPVGGGQPSTEEHWPDTAPKATSPQTPLAPHSGQVWGTPEGLRAEGDSGFGSWGVSPKQKAGCRLGDPPNPMGTRSPGSDTPRAERNGRWCRGGPQRDDAPPGMLQPPGKGPSPHRPGWQDPVDSFEMEEVLSASEDEEDEEGDAHEEGARSLHPPLSTRRGLMLHASSGRSDSSGFAEEPLSSHPPGST